MLLDMLNEILSWLSEKESALSALAALVVIIGVTLSPLGTGLRGFISQRELSKDKLRDNDTATPATSSGILAPAVSTGSTGADDPLDTPPPLITDKPSIAVLPFVNMSDDKEKEYFADGMTEDIITGLSCDHRLFVIARNSTFAYKGQSPDIRNVGKELGVRYVLEGSIRPVAERLRITVQLIETDTGSHVWADKIDRPLAEIFDIQDDVVDSLVSALCANLSVAEGKRAARQEPENLEAWQLCVQAETIWIGQRTIEALKKCQLLTERAAQIEPHYALGCAMFAYFSTVPIPYLLTDNPAGTAAKSIELCKKAVLLAPDDARVLGFAGSGIYLAGQGDIAVDYCERSLTLNPNHGNIRLHYANALLVSGRHQECFEQHERFFRQSPLDPSIGLAYMWRSVGLSTQAKYADARHSATLAIKHQPGFPWSYVAMSQALAGLEQYDEAYKTVVQLSEIAPNFTLEKLTAYYRFLFSNPEDAESHSNLAHKAWAG